MKRYTMYIAPLSTNTFTWIGIYPHRHLTGWKSVRSHFSRDMQNVDSSLPLKSLYGSKRANIFIKGQQYNIYVEKRMKKVIRKKRKVTEFKEGKFYIRKQVVCRIYGNELKEYKQSGVYSIFACVSICFPFLSIFFLQWWLLNHAVQFLLNRCTKWYHLSNKDCVSCLIACNYGNPGSMLGVKL